MTPILTYDQYIQHALNILQNQDGPVRVSSFNLRVIVDSPSEELFSKLLTTDFTMLVGTSYRMCSPDCSCCIATNAKRSHSLELFIKSHKIKVFDNLHLKYFSRGSQAIVGGMNLTSSGFSDLALLVGNKDSIKQMNNHFDSISNSFDSNKLFTVKEPSFSFGKYRGKTVKEVLKIDPAYIEWSKTNLRRSDLEYLKLV